MQQIKRSTYGFNVHDSLVALMAVVITVLVCVSSYQWRKINAYELAFKAIASDMQINYGLHRGAIEQLKDCK